MGWPGPETTKVQGARKGLSRLGTGHYVLLLVLPLPTCSVQASHTCLMASLCGSSRAGRYPPVQKLRTLRGQGQHPPLPLPAWVHGQLL